MTRAVAGDGRLGCRVRLLTGLLAAWLVPVGDAAAGMLPGAGGGPERTAVFGVKAGLSSSRLTGDAHGAWWRPGLVAGVQVEVPANEALAGRMEFLYHQVGARHVQVGSTWYLGQPPPVPVYADSRRNYFELGLLAKFRPFGSGIYWLGGPVFGALLSRAERSVGSPPGDDYWDPANPAAPYESNQILQAPARTSGSLLLGVGAEWSVANQPLFLEARFQWGLQDINRTAWFELRDRCWMIVTGATL